MVCTHGGGESSISVNHPASEASKESADRRGRGGADVIGRKAAKMATKCATSAGAGARTLQL